MNAHPSSLIQALLLFALSACSASQPVALSAKTPTMVTTAETPAVSPSLAANVVGNAAPAGKPAPETTPATPLTKPNPDTITDGKPVTTPVAPRSLRDYQQSLGKACQRDADCVVKNVGSCCGYQPQCVHKDVQTFPEQVKALCEKEGRSSICGFQEPAGCSCVNNQCRSSAGSGL
ncbi:hypothetical protein HPT27_08715 [Permianibacter sp. IMCC34836]|uniref:hypothetical protein n=1 Tax=Permianibacter fluminis TaxID=2738515 RepID=UPI0015564955|nr:hypothetical protein [Permianibacter fluminis]NQD37105.1 hypothetical protein [Permianibacter fluminis]